MRVVAELSGEIEALSPLPNRPLTAFFAFVVVTTGIAGPLEYAASWLFRSRDGSQASWELLVLPFTTSVGVLFGSVVSSAVFGIKSALRGAPLRQLLLGALAATGLMTCCVSLQVLSGHGTLRLGDGGWLDALRHLAVNAPSGVVEELLVRGAALTALRRATHDWLAVLITSLAFGAFHMLNPNVTSLALVNVTLFGLGLGLLVVRWSLWASIGLHVGWNFAQGFVFGQPVSALSPGRSVFVSTWSEPGFFSGGDFGPEGAGVTTFVALLGLAVVSATRQHRGAVRSLQWWR